VSGSIPDVSYKAVGKENKNKVPALLELIFSWS
jgi:hypothetical protein